VELRSLANGVPFLYSDFKFNLNTKNKVFPIPVSVCCPLNLFNLSIDAFNGTVGKCTIGHILDEIADGALAYYDLSKRRRRRRLIITQCNLST